MLKSFTYLWSDDLLYPDELGQPKIGNLDDSLLGNENILGLQVSMDDGEGMEELDATDQL